MQFYDVVHLAFYFGVSYESALWRLKTLKLISEEERAKLASQSESATSSENCFGRKAEDRNAQRPEKANFNTNC